MSLRLDNTVHPDVIAADKALAMTSAQLKALYAKLKAAAQPKK